MTVTLTQSYKETLKPETVEFIQGKCIEGDYYLEDALIFIDEHSEDEFVAYYEEFIELGEQYTFDAVDAYLTLYDLDELACFGERYIGEFCSHARMAEEYFDGETDRLDYRISIDWEETGEYLIQHDVDRVGDFYFRCY